jgi:hypothetical protein
MLNLSKPSDPQHLCHLEFTTDGPSEFAGFLSIRRIDDPLEGPSRYGWKIEIPGKFQSRQELIATGNTFFGRFLKGEVSSPTATEKEKFRGYRITGSARFQAVDLKWEPVLEIKKVEEPNKGTKQIIVGPNTVFPRNLFPSPEGAAKFAFEFGKRMVLGIVQGLEI